MIIKIILAASHKQQVLYHCRLQSTVKENNIIALFLYTSYYHECHSYFKEYFFVQGFDFIG